MSQLFPRGFGSDNHSATHPEILQAFIEAQKDHAPSYGTDDYSEQAQQLFKKHFGPQCEAYFVFNGTAANVLSLKVLTKSYQSVFCSDISHLHVDECGAPEVLGSFKLWPLASKNGKMNLEDLKKNLIRRGDQHFSQFRVVSLTQPTEYGTTYSLQELKEISQWAHSEGLKVHIDGARLCNAVRSLQTDFKQMITDLNIDAVSFGGTKNGFAFGEAVLIFNSELKEDMKYYRKQLTQLPSKTRFIAAQFKKYLENNLWQKIADHSLSQAQLLRKLLSEIPQIEITQPTQSNVVFAKIPPALVKELRKSYFFYVWDEKTFECRLMTSWDTQEEEIYGLIKKVKELL